MYQTLIVLHTYMRWLVLASLLFAIYKACKGYISKSAFIKTDNAVRHWTATISHIQLVIGMVLYFKSPITNNFWINNKEAITNSDLAFFGLLHVSLMLIAIVLITIGSAMAKRKQTDRQKFKTMLIWFSVALFIIFIAIPWPFSPLATRPYYR
jgi:cytochrome bd-type quinol oxidase subunit 2